MLGNTRFKLGLAPKGYSSWRCIWKMDLTQSQFLGNWNNPRASLMLNINEVLNCFIYSTFFQWNLVCDDLWKLSTIQGSYMGGVFVGCMVWGWASDKFGRRLTMLVAAVIQVASSILAAFAPNYIIFIMLRFLIAFSVSGVFECGFVLVTEICGPHYRTYFGILTQFPFGWGAALLPVIAYFIRAWKSLQLAISIPCVLLGIFYW